MNGRASRLATAAASKAVERDKRLDGFDSLTFRFQLVPLAERQRLQASNLARRVRLPQGTLGDRLTVGRLPLKQAVKVRILLPELSNPDMCWVSLIKQIDAEQLLLVVTPGSEPGGRWFDSNFCSSKDGSHPAG